MKKAYTRTSQPPMYSDNDDSLERTFIDYPVLTSENSYVVSGPLGTMDKPWISGRKFESIDAAIEWVSFTYGGYYERIRGAEPDRWAFRVIKGSHREQREGFRAVMAHPESDGKTKFRAV